MGICLNCFRDPKNKPKSQESTNIITPDAEARRQAAAEAASRRLQQNDTRGVDENEYRRLKQRQSDVERLQQKQDQLSKQYGDDSGGLRWQVN